MDDAEELRRRVFRGLVVCDLRDAMNALERAEVHMVMAEEAGYIPLFAAEGERIAAITQLLESTT